MEMQEELPYENAKQNAQYVQSYQQPPQYGQPMYTEPMYAQYPPQPNDQDFSKPFPTNNVIYVQGSPPQQPQSTPIVYVVQQPQQSGVRTETVLNIHNQNTRGSAEEVMCLWVLYILGWFFYFPWCVGSFIFCGNKDPGVRCATICHQVTLVLVTLLIVGLIILWIILVVVIREVR